MRCNAHIDKIFKAVCAIPLHHNAFCLRLLISRHASTSDSSAIYVTYGNIATRQKGVKAYGSVHHSTSPCTQEQDMLQDTG